MSTPQPSSRKRQIHGRRLGKKLRPGQLSLLSDLLPSLRIPVTPDQPQDLDLGTLFESPRQETWLEIGFGGGEHLVHQAESHPETGFLGCEPFINGMAKLLRTISLNGLSNIRIYDDDARDLISCLPDASIDRIYLLYPDPWPKRRHHKRRFVQVDVLLELARIMADKAELYFATDIPDLIDWTFIQLQQTPEFSWQARSAEDWRQPYPGWPGTRYEAKALREGRTPAYLTFQRLKRG